MGKEKDRGWEYLNSDAVHEFDFDKSHDGSWGYTNEDGSGSFHGGDGSWGYKDSDGRASYYGVDGSWGYKDSDGRVSYYGADGAWGYKNSDGSGSYWGASDDADDEDNDEDLSSNEDSGVENNDSGSSWEGLGQLIGYGVATYAAIKGIKESTEREERIRRANEAREAQKMQAARQRKRKENRAKRFSFYKRHWKGILAFIAALIVFAISWSAYNRIKKNIPMGVSSDYLVGIKYSRAVSTLEKNGFTNIHVQPIYDITIKDTLTEGNVKRVSVSGTSAFEITDKFPYDARIDIEYHAVQNITVPMSSDDATDLDYIALKEAFSDAGFVNIKYEVEYDLILGWLTSDGEVESISIDGEEEFSETASYRPDVEVIITYHTFKSNKPD